MKYGWNISEIEEKKNRLKKSFNNVDRYIYDRMLMDYNLKFRDFTITLNPKTFFKTVDKFDLKYFDSPFFQIISYIAPQIENLDFTYSCVFSPSLTDEDTVKICKDFYKKVDKSNFNYFKQFVSIPSRIQFIKDNNTNPFNGRSYIISNNEFYVLVNFRNYIQDIITFYHESKHIENKLKGYDEGIGLYQELPAILYTFYMFDHLTLIGDNQYESQCVRKELLSKYCKLIVKINNQVKYIKRLKTDSNFYDNINQNYLLYYGEDELFDIYTIMQRGFSEKSIGNVVSFLVSIYIYMNSTLNNATNAISLYMFGMRKLKPSMVDDIIKFLKEEFNNSLNDEKNKQKVKKVVDK